MKYLSRIWRFIKRMRAERAENFRAWGGPMFWWGGTKDFPDGGGQVSMGGDKVMMGGSPPPSPPIAANPGYLPKQGRPLIGAHSHFLLRSPIAIQLSVDG